MDDVKALIGKSYDGFNRRDIPTVFEFLTEDVEWANGMDGGHVHGREAVRDYWTGQWAAILPHVEPQNVAERDGGSVAVEVHQVVHDLEGNLLLDETVRHVFRFRNGLIARFDIENPGGLSSIAHG